MAAIVKLMFVLFGYSQAAPATLAGQPACPPSCATNELLELLDKYCSDKVCTYTRAHDARHLLSQFVPWRPQGTFWQSKHHYATAYHALFGSLRSTITSMLEIGIGEDTAPSVQAWATYFPNAHIYPVDIKTRKEVAERARPSGPTDRLVKHQAQFGCDYNRSMWDNPRIHLTLETDASDPKQLGAVPLPEQLDIILDDGSHKFFDQQRTLHTLWPRLRPGGFYIIEDMLVGALPWDSAHSKQVPSANTECGAECFFPQRLAEHPFLFDRFGHLKGPAKPKVALDPQTQTLLRANDWFWMVTGVHQGGGLDASMVIRKGGAPLGLVPSSGPSASSPAAAIAALPSGATSNACTAARPNAAAIADAQKALLGAQALQAKLQEQQAVLAARLQRAEAEAARPMEEPGAEIARSDWPALALLCVSLVANFVQWNRRQLRPGKQ